MLPSCLICGLTESTYHLFGVSRHTRVEPRHLAYHTDCDIKAGGVLLAA